MCCRSRRSFASQSSHSSDSSARRSTNIHVTAGGVLVLVLGGTFGARWIYGQVLGDDSSSSSSSSTRIDPYRQDKSKATVLLQTTGTASAKGGGGDEKVNPKNLVGGKTAQGVKLTQVDKADFEAFLAQQRAILASAQKQSQDKAARVLRTELQNAMVDATDRVASFCDWYLSYPTTYKLLGIAMSSATQYAVSFPLHKDAAQDRLATKVSQDIQGHVCRKYEAMVLRPAVIHPKIHRAFVASLHQAHEDYLQAIANLETSVAKFVSKNGQSSSYAVPPSSNDVIVNMDWDAQLAKVQHVPLAYEKSPELTVGLVTAGAAVGKLAGAASLGGAVKALGAKLAAPFATKAAGTALAGKAAAGATAGGVLGGPLGATVGAAVGIGVDVAVNAGVALMQRSALEKDVHESLDATLMEWEERLRPELDRVQSVWYGHAVGLLQIETQPDDDDNDDSADHDQARKSTVTEQPTKNTAS